MATAAAVAMAAMVAAMAMAVEAPLATLLQACESKRRGSVRAAWAGRASAGRFEPLKAHQSSVEEVVGVRKEPPAELRETGRSAGGCEQRGWTNSSLSSQFPMQTMLARGSGMRIAWPWQLERASAAHDRWRFWHQQ